MDEEEGEKKAVGQENEISLMWPLVINGILILVLIVLLVIMFISSGKVSTGFEEIDNGVDELGSLGSVDDDDDVGLDDNDNIGIDDVNIEDEVVEVNYTGNESNDNVEIDGVDEVLESIDCVEDFSCFISAGENCLEASVRREVAILDGLSIVELTIGLELGGLEGGKCKYGHEIMSLNLEFENSTIEDFEEQGMSMEEIELQRVAFEEDAKEHIGETRECLFEIDDLNAMFMRWDEGELDGSDWDVAEC